MNKKQVGKVWWNADIIKTLPVKVQVKGVRKWGAKEGYVQITQFTKQ